MRGEGRAGENPYINVYSEGSFQVSIKDYHPYPSSKRREPPVLAFGAGATDVPFACWMKYAAVRVARVKTRATGFAVLRLG